MRDIPDILAKIVAAKRVELEKTTVSRNDLEQRAHQVASGRRDFRSAIQRTDLPAIIAEIKRGSPSKGILAKYCDPLSLAKEYQRGGAACLSVLTDRDFFRGSLEDLRAAKAAVSLPVLRKDFTIDEHHVIEAAAWGADAILLIAAILNEKEIRRFRDLAQEFGMCSLVEVHNEEELKVALGAGADVVGVNNRDLRSFTVTLETSLRLADAIPDCVTKVSESGIHCSSDLERLHKAGFNAFLIGEHLMKSDSPAQAIQSLLFSTIINQ